MRSANRPISLGATSMAGWRSARPVDHNKLRIGTDLLCLPQTKLILPEEEGHVRRNLAQHHRVPCRVMLKGNHAGAFAGPIKRAATRSDFHDTPTRDFQILQIVAQTIGIPRRVLPGLVNGGERARRGRMAPSQQTPDQLHRPKVQIVVEVNLAERNHRLPIAPGLFQLTLQWASLGRSKRFMTLKEIRAGPRFLPLFTAPLPNASMVSDKCYAHPIHGLNF